MLSFYRDTPLVPATKVPRLDIFTADGVLYGWDLANKSVPEMAGIVQVGNTQYRQTAGSVFKTSTGFTLSVVPADGDKVIVPSTIRLSFRVYDNSSVPGVSDPNQDIVPLILADVETIVSNQYEKSAANAAILIQVTDNDPLYGAVADWIQLGYADPETGDPSGTWLDPGEPLEIIDLANFSSLVDPATALDTSIMVEDGDLFDASQTTIFIIIEPGVSGKEEVKQVSTVVGDEINLITPLTYDHDAGATVYLCGVQVYGKLIYPLDAPDGPLNLFDVSIDAVYDELSRIG